MPLVPNPVGNTLKKVDRTIDTVEDLLGRVEGTLRDVRDLLAELEEEMQLLRQVPEIAAKVDEIHKAVTP